MKYLLLLLLVGCTTVEFVTPIEVSVVPILCEIDNDSMEYCVSIWTMETEDSECVEIESYNLSWLVSNRFIAYVPTNGVEVLVTAYENGFEGGITHYSNTIIHNPVAYNWGESRGISNGYKNESGDIMYTLSPLKLK